MSEGPFPRPARRFASVGFSEIVVVRNRVLDLLAAGHKVWRFEGGEPYMATPEPVKDAMGAALARERDALRAVLGNSGAAHRRSSRRCATATESPADAESPIVVNGGMHGLFAAFATLLDPGDEVLMFSPYWTPIARRRRVPRGARRPRLDGGGARARAWRARSRARSRRAHEGALLELARQSDRRGLLAAPRSRRSRRSPASTASR